MKTELIKAMEFARIGRDGVPCELAAIYLDAHRFDELCMECQLFDFTGPDRDQFQGVQIYIVRKPYIRTTKAERPLCVVNTENA